MVEKVICEGNIWDVHRHRTLVTNNGYVLPLPLCNEYLNVNTDNWDDRILSPNGGEFYNFSGTGYISVKLTNLGNYIVSTGEEIDSAHYKFDNNFKIELYNNNEVLISSVDMAPVSPATSTLGSSYSNVNISVPNAGLYYLKIKIGSNYIFYDIECAGNSVIASVVKCDWELYVKAVEYVEDGEDVEENIPVVFPKTIYEGYILDCYTHISDVNSNGYVNAYPVTDDGYLKIGDESGGFENMIASRGDKYYLWSYNDGGVTKGVVTRKRNPLKMEISDIVGEYVIDGDGVSEYLGLQNIEDNVNKHNWVGILSDRSNGYDTLIIQWRTIDNNSGVDTLTFVDELNDIFFVDETVTHNVVWDNRVCKSVSFTGSGSSVNPFYDSQSDYYLQIGTDSDKYVYFNLLHSGIVTIKLECKNAKLDYSGSTATHTVSDNFSIHNVAMRVEIYDKLGNVVERKQIAPRCYTTANTDSSKEEYTTVSFNLPRGPYSFAINVLGTFYGPFGYKGSNSESAELLTYWDLTYDIYEVVSDDIDTSTSLNEYCYNFSNSGYIDITITNNGNYLMDGEEIANGSISTPLTSAIQLYNNMGVLVSTTKVYPLYPSSARRGEMKNTVNIVIPSAGTYYIKYRVNILYYGMTTGEDAILSVKDCQLKSYWSLHVNAVELSTDIDRCVSFNDYLCYWYEKSDRNENFHPDNISVDSYFKIWDGLDSKQRVLWNDVDNMVDITDINNYYAWLTSLHYYIPIYDKNGVLLPNQLIRVKDIPNFKLVDLSLDEILYPDVDGEGSTTFIYSDGGSLGWYQPISLSYSNDFSSLDSEFCGYVAASKVYYDPNEIDSAPKYLQLLFSVKNTNEAIITESSYTPTIDVTFGNGYTYTFNVVSKTYTGSGPYTSGITAMCNNTEGFKMDEICTISKIDYSGLYFTTVGSSQPNPEPTYHKLYYLNYWLGTGVNGRIYLSNYANDVIFDGNTCDFISLDGSTVLAGNVPFTIESNAIKIDSSKLGSVLGKDCYLMVRCKYDSSHPNIYLCFRVNVQSNNFNIINVQQGDCTLWLRNGGTIYMYTRNGNAVKLCPMRGNFNGKFTNGVMSECFAHGHLYTGNSSNYFGISYMSGFGNSDISELYSGEVFSLIPSICRSIYDVYEYMAGSPNIDIYIHK